MSGIYCSLLSLLDFKFTQLKTKFSLISFNVCLIWFKVIFGFQLDFLSCYLYVWYLLVIIKFTWFQIHSTQTNFSLISFNVIFGFQ